MHIYATCLHFQTPTTKRLILKIHKFCQGILGDLSDIYIFLFDILFMSLTFIVLNQNII